MKKRVEAKSKKSYNAISISIQLGMYNKLHLSVLCMKSYKKPDVKNCHISIAIFLQ